VCFGPVVLLEVQMHPDPGFHHRLAAQTYRFLQQHPRVEHWAVLVITPHNRLKLGPTQALQVFLNQQVDWINLEELSQQPSLDPLLNLLTLPIRPESELQTSSRDSSPTAQIQALPLEQLEALAVGEAFSAGVALLDFQGPADLAAWLAANT
jgi:predicted transposase YdaD